MELAVRKPRRIWWARPRKLCALERPGGGGRNHRAARRGAEIEYLRGLGVRLIVSVMRSRHNLEAYEAAGLDWHHVPVRTTDDGAQALEELLPLLRHELEATDAVAIHGDSHTDFVAAVCAAHLHETRGVDPAEALTRAARAGLAVTPEACALLGVDVGEMEALMRAGGAVLPPGRGPKRPRAGTTDQPAHGAASHTVPDIDETKRCRGGAISPHDD